MRFRRAIDLGFWCPLFGCEPLIDFGFSFADVFFHLLDFDGVIALLMLSKQEQVGFVLRSIAMKKPFVFGFDRCLKLVDLVGLRQHFLSRWIAVTELT